MTEDARVHGDRSVALAIGLGACTMFYASLLLANAVTRLHATGVFAAMPSHTRAVRLAGAAALVTSAVATRGLSWAAIAAGAVFIWRTSLVFDGAPTAASVAIAAHLAQTVIGMVGLALAGREPGLWRAHWDFVAASACALWLATAVL